MEKYYIYHLPKFIHKDGSVGKIGVSVEPIRRTKDQGFTEYEILEEFSCMYLVSYREIALQKQYGYKVDNILYWKTRLSRSIGDCIKGGDRQGPRNVESGHMDKIRILGNIKRSKPILVYTLDDNFIAEYPSGRECARQLNLNPSCITDVLKGNQYQTKGYVIKYKE